MLRGRVLLRAASTVAAPFNFGCTLCGRCCALGKDRAVLVSAQEVAALERHTSLPPSAFVQLSSESGTPTLQKTRTGDCVFLDRERRADGARKCSVYDARPTQCRTYPFWGETTSPLGWLRESARCEGIGRGDAVPHSEVALDVVQTDLALAGETTTFGEDRMLLEAIPGLVAEQFEEHRALGGVTRLDTAELCVVDSSDPQTDRMLRTLVLRSEPSLSQSVAYLDGDDVVPTELAMPVHQALALALSFCRARPAHVLVIGGGGCSLPLALATVVPGARVTVVELSSGVADAARRFFIPVGAPLELVVADGADFLRSCHEFYDLIIIDAADAEQSPAPALASSAFVDTLHAKLTEHGTVAVNCFGDATSAFVRRVAERFGHGTAALELAADDGLSVHTIVFAQKRWAMSDGDVAETWRARARLASGASSRLCSADAARQAADNLRPVS